MKKIRDALEKLPAVVYMNQLLESGALNLKFQSRGKYKPKQVDVVLN